MQLQQDFAGVYAPASWTLAANGGNGSVDTTGAPGSISLTGSNQRVGFDFGPSINTDYTTTAFASGPVSFNWVYSSIDTPGYDGFGYLLNGAFTLLAATDGSSGLGQFNVLAGDTFGFRAFTVDDTFGPGIATISNFSAPTPVPGPLPIFGIAAGFGFSRRLRRRIKLAKSPVGTDSVAAEQL